MNLSINLTPTVVLANRVAGSFGICELISLSCTVTPATANIAALGGVGYKVKQGTGKLSGANTGLGTAIFTASGTAEIVKVAAFGLNDTNKELAIATLKIVAPQSLKFTKVGNSIKHTQGQADAGFMGKVSLEPAGVSYERLRVREGEFKGKGTGYYAVQDNMLHPATAGSVSIINGNQINGDDSIYSGIQGQPWSAGKFEWNIPWQYQTPGNTEWVTFAYANHVQEITASGVVSIGKFNAGPFAAKPSDPTQP